jgi:hypothetical protein
VEERMISKEQFVGYIEELVELNTIAERANKEFRKLDPDFNFISFGRYGSLILKILKDAFNDTRDAWIEYWIYDLKFGKEYKEGSVTIDGKDITLKTADNLYDMLIDNIENNKAILLKDKSSPWEGLYVNGILKQEGYTLNRDKDRIKYFVELSKQYEFDLENMKIINLCNKDIIQLENDGGLPKSIDELKSKYIMEGK